MGTNYDYMNKQAAKIRDDWNSSYDKYWNINILEKFKKKWPYNFNPNYKQYFWPEYENDYIIIKKNEIFNKISSLNNKIKNQYDIITNLKTKLEIKIQKLIE